MKIKIPSKIRACLSILLVLAVLYFIAIFDLEYGFYIFLRLISTAALIAFVCIYASFRDNVITIPNSIAGLIIILFNPFFQVYFDKETWVVIDLICCAIMIALSVFIFIKHMETYDNDYRIKRKFSKKPLWIRQLEEIEKTIPESIFSSCKPYWHFENNKYVMLDTYIFWGFFCENAYIRPLHDENFLTAFHFHYFTNWANIEPFSSLDKKDVYTFLTLRCEMYRDIFNNYGLSYERVFNAYIHFLQNDIDAKPFSQEPFSKDDYIKPSLITDALEIDKRISKKNERTLYSLILMKHTVDFSAILS